MMKVIPPVRLGRDHRGMKTALRVTPLVVSALVIAAHFFRSGNYGFVIFALVCPLLLMTRQKRAVMTVQLLLGIAAIEWIRTAVGIARERAAFGAPTTRMFVILGAVALFTALSALPLRRVTASTNE
jgi:hypothetical protein